MDCMLPPNCRSEKNISASLTCRAILVDLQNRAIVLLRF